MTGRRPRRCQSNAQLGAFLLLPPLLPPPPSSSSSSSSPHGSSSSSPRRTLSHPLGPGDGGGRRAGGAGRPMRYRAGGGKGAAPRAPSQRRAGRGTRGRGSGITLSFPVRGSRGYKPSRGVPDTNPPGEFLAVQTLPGVPARCGSSSRSAGGATAPGETGSVRRAFTKSLILAYFFEGEEQKSGCVRESSLKSHLITR